MSIYGGSSQEDFNLMFHHDTNSSGTPANLVGQELDDDRDWVEERRRAIADMESQIEAMKVDVEPRKNAKLLKKSKKEKVPFSSTPKALLPGQAPENNMADSDVLSSGQKKELGERISKLDGEGIEHVIKIIRDGVPEIRDDTTGEIEVDIDDLPPAVLTSLYEYVTQSVREPTPYKPQSTDNKEVETVRQSVEGMTLLEPHGGSQGETGCL